METRSNVEGYQRYGALAGPRLTVTSEIDAHSELEGALVASNESQVGAVGSDVQLCLRAPEGGLVAGISGATWGETAWIHVLWVEPELRLRGHGAALLAAFENHARGVGCLQVLVSTYSFQALPFYERHGYVVLSRIAHVPTAGSDLIHLAKRWDGRPRGG
jgi:GNAT superfamily N-acetyltransferase